MMPDLFRPTLDDQIAEVKREIALRARVYPRWVSSGRMTAEDADRKREVLVAVLLTLLSLKAAES